MIQVSGTTIVVIALVQASFIVGLLLGIWIGRR